ncbi:Hypothetical protein AKI40_2511 [Enterobacter sp. FY-07]|nr:Hypothetical protein AKI40_2511 [Enterobacter sp. FY-07]
MLKPYPMTSLPWSCLIFMSTHKNILIILFKIKVIVVFYLQSANDLYFFVHAELTMKNS